MKARLGCFFVLVSLSFNVSAMTGNVADGKVVTLSQEQVVYGKLLCAITFKNLEGVKAIIEQNPDLRNVRPVPGGPSILNDFMQVFETYPDKEVFVQILKLLIEHGVNVNEPDGDKNTILHWIAGQDCSKSSNPKKRRQESLEKSIILIGVGANPCLKNSLQQSAADLASLMKNRDLAEYLQKQRALFLKKNPYFVEQQAVVQPQAVITPQQELYLQQQAALEEFYHSMQTDPALMCPLL